MNDEIVQVGDRFYIKATSTITNETGDNASVSAFAREPLSRKGMDDSQVTGGASSYARKYALCGLFAIDGEKDADALNNNSSYTEKSIPQDVLDLRDMYKNGIGLAPDLNSVKTIWETAQKYLKPYPILYNEIKNLAISKGNSINGKK